MPAYQRHMIYSRIAVISGSSYDIKVQLVVLGSVLRYFCEHCVVFGIAAVHVDPDSYETSEHEAQFGGYRGRNTLVSFIFYRITERIRRLRCPSAGYGGYFVLTHFSADRKVIESNRIRDDQTCDFGFDFIRYLELVYFIVRVFDGACAVAFAAGCSAALRTSVKFFRARSG
ncbi:hypothetical protein SDC9_129485 [bioreactor metagenome]|uniref:Uncharacterized protein n=1 Tax=bioreactor metagenome TaxID=1076179 RepID=A0A645CZM8_9ZZZZ